MLLRRVLQYDVVTVGAGASVLEAARLMRAEHVGGVVVVDARKRPIGVLTDRDIVVGVVAKDVEHMSTLTVADVLSSEPVIAFEDEDVDAVLARMRKRGVRRVPVVDRAGTLVAIFAVDDILRALADNLKSVVTIVARQRQQEQTRRS